MFVCNVNVNVKFGFYRIGVLIKFDFNCLNDLLCLFVYIILFGFDFLVRFDKLVDFLEKFFINFL